MGDIMQIFIMLMSFETIILDVKSSDTIINIKTKIHNKMAEVHIEHMYLVFNKNYLENDRTLAYYNVQKDSILHLALKLAPPGEYVKYVFRQY